MNIKAIAPAVVIILATVGAAVWYFLANTEDSTAPLGEGEHTVASPVIADSTEQPASGTPSSLPRKIKRSTAEQATTTPQAQALPPLADIPSRLTNSDLGFLQAAQKLAPKMVAWLTPDQQIRKWVFLVDNIAAGKIPSKNRPLSYDIDKFQVDEATAEDRFYVSETNFARADTLINVVTALPPQELIRYYQHWLPLLNNAYDELGRGDSFQDRLLQAIDNILAIEPLPEKALLQQPSVFYVYADKKLEKADKLNKFFWRLGSENTEKIQSFLTNIEPLIN